MTLLCIGLNHKTAPIALRERLAFDGATLSRALRDLLLLPGISEAMILSTCNRVEVIALVPDAHLGEQAIRTFLANARDIAAEEFTEHLYVHQSTGAVRHLFRVASSLDSMIVGEPQILGQIKDAYRLALDEEATGKILNRLLEKAFSVAKSVRNETRIAERAVSVSYAAVELAGKIFADLSRHSMMLVGAGEMGQLAARHLHQAGAKGLVITSRTFDRAVELARDLDGTPVEFERFPSRLEGADIVICAGAATEYIIDRACVEAAMRKRKHRPMFFIDISVPRNIDPATNKVENVYLYDIDDLEGVVEANLKEREQEARKAEKIIAAEVSRFCGWMDSLDVEPTIAAVREKVELIRKGELQKTFTSVKDLTPEQRQRIEALTGAIVNKVLHGPFTYLKSAGENGGSASDTALVRRIFGIEEEEE